MMRIFETLKNHFIPHQGNNFKPRLLSHRSILQLLLFILIFELLFLLQIFFVFKKTDFLASVLPPVLTSLTNEEREKNNLPPLEQSELLRKAAQLKAEDMATRGYFSHTSPEGLLPWHFFDQVGYSYSYAGENLAVNFFDSKDVAEAWMNSPTHRANIMKKNFTQIGIGVASGIFEGKNTVFVAEFFGTPTGTAKVTSPVNTEPKKSPAALITSPSDSRVLGEVVTDKPTEKIIITSTVPESSVKLSLQKVFSAPRQHLAYVYGGIGLFILSLLLIFFIRSEIRHPWIVLRGLALVTVIISLLFVNVRVLRLEANVGNESAENGTNVAY